MRHIILSVIFVLIFSEIFPQALLNEFSSSNLMTIADEDGAYSDWIELYNGSSGIVSLQGYHLSDTRSYLSKWTFPDVSLRPGTFMLVFASGKNRTTLPVTYKTIIDRGEIWQYIVPQSEQGDSWKTTGFDASSWSSGKSGFGYADGDDSTLLGNIASVFIRKEFTLTNITDIAQIVLSIDYDDGFVAYINGHEIARSNLGTISPVPFNFLTGSLSHEATMYLGGYPENYNVQNPGSFLKEGVNVIAIQGHNSDLNSSDFSLIPILTIGRITAAGKDSIPSYVQVSGTRLHTNFKIKDEGESLILSRPDSSVVDSISPVILQADFSYGRQPDGGNNWFYFATPTPGGPNNTRGYSALSMDTVLFSVKGGYYPGGINLQLSSVHNSDSIFYTLDGSEPSLSSEFYTAPLSITGNTTVRARSFKKSELPGPVATNTYITKRHSLPVVCLSTDPSNLFDYYTGIYAMGPNASPDVPYFGANFWQDWERKAHMEYYDTSGIKQIDQDIGIKIYGAWSRAYPEKSLALFARKMYGKGAFEYKFFRDKPIDKFESVILRNAGNDWDCAFVRDGLTSMMVRDMDIDRQAYQPCVIYINGEYWGMLNMREKINSNYLAENHFINPDNVNLLELAGTVIEGNNTSYMQLVDYLNNNTLESESRYKDVAAKVDLDNFIQYNLTEIYINNTDWPGNNIKFWKTNDYNSQWRWVIYDTDFGLNIWNETAYTYNTLSYALDPNGPDWPNPPWSTLFLRRMVSNQVFRNEFITQFADRLNRNFSEARVRAVVDSTQQMALPEIQDHLTRWDLSYDNWLYNYNNIRNFGQYRPAYMRIFLRNQFGLGEPCNIKIEINTPGAGVVKVNSIIPYKFPFNGIYFQNLPITLTAIPSPGFKFVRWETGTVQSTATTMKYDMSDSRAFRAVFEQAKTTDIKIVINEINYVSPPSHDTKDWIELYNAGTATINLRGWTVSDGSRESGFVIPADYDFTPGSYYILCRNLADFRLFWPSLTASAGNFDFGLSSSGDDINLFDPDGNLVDFVSYKITAPWPTDAERQGTSIELIDPLSDNNDGKNWKTKMPGGTPGRVNSTYNQQDTTGSNVEKCLITCYPNPFSDYTTLQAEIKTAGRYRIEIFSTQGYLIDAVTDQTLEPGRYFIDWYGQSATGSPLPGGVYILRLSGEGEQSNTRVVKLK